MTSALKGVPSSASIQPGTSAISNGATVDGLVCHGTHILTVVASAGVSAGVVTLQVSPDGVNWYTPASFTAITLTAPGTSSSVLSGTPAQFVRAAITTAITGGTVAAYVGSA